MRIPLSQLTPSFIGKRPPKVALTTEIQSMWSCVIVLESLADQSAQAKATGEYLQKQLKIAWLKKIVKIT